MNRLKNKSTKFFLCLVIIFCTLFFGRAIEAADTEFSSSLTNDRTFIRPTLPSDREESGVSFDDVFIGSDLLQGDHSYLRNYFIQHITVPAGGGGEYTIQVTSASLFKSTGSVDPFPDTVLFIYEDSFDSTSPLVNIVAANDDIDTNKSNYLSKLVLDLDGNKTYVLVMTTYSNGTTGNVTFKVSGPSSVQYSNTPPQATPTFSPVAGAVVFGTELEIVSEGAEHIYYTLDGSEPTTSVGGSTYEYSVSAKPIIDAAMTVKAIATRTDYLNSVIGEAVYTQAETVDLTNLELSGSPSNYTFEGHTYTYNGVTVANEVDSITLTPTGEGTITVDGVSVTTGEASTAIALTPGEEETITIVVTEPGKSAITYVISVMRIVERVPDAPVLNSVRAGNGQVTVYFSVPNDGGSPITSYEVTVLPDDITVTGQSGAITVSGLTNGKRYTFIVKAINEIGSSLPSNTSNQVRPVVPSSNDDTVPPAQQSLNTDYEVLVNGESENVGTAVTTTRGNQSVITVAIDPTKIEEKLALEGQHAVIIIPVNTGSDIVVGQLNGQIVKNMEQKEAVVQVRTENASYTVPALQINVSGLLEQFGQEVDLQDIILTITISELADDTVRIVESSALSGQFTIVAPPVSFVVNGTYKDQTIEVDKFNAYVERTIAIPDGIDPNQITTGIVVEPDGTVRHVPTKISVTDGKYYAVINSLTNSIYSVVHHQKQFNDVENHWAKEPVNDMGSRMVISGVSSDNFNPDHNITRAEFTAIIVRALGLKQGTGSTPFTDVKLTDWYSGYILAALEYNLISGYEDGSFRPTNTITREQAMAIISNAMELTNLQVSQSAMIKQLEQFTDASTVAEWAKNHIFNVLAAGIVLGKENQQLAPKDSITRAEVAVIIQRLLQLSDLI